MDKILLHFENLLWFGVLLMAIWQIVALLFIFKGAKTVGGSEEPCFAPGALLEKDWYWIMTLANI